MRMADFRPLHLHVNFAKLVLRSARVSNRAASMSLDMVVDTWVTKGITTWHHGIIRPFLPADRTQQAIIWRWVGDRRWVGLRSYGRWGDIALLGRYGGLGSAVPLINLEK